MKKETYKIHGMSCASCVKTIESTLLKTKGVKSAVVNFASGTALIEFDENVIREEGLAEIIKSIGYILITSSPENTDNRGKTKTISLKVIGMDSPHCAIVVEKVIKSLSGIKSVDVDFSNRRAKVIFDLLILGSDDILNVITDAGYKPSVEKEGRKDIKDKEKDETEKQIRKLKTKLLVGGVLAILIFLGSFSKIFPFVPDLLGNSWVLFALATPIQFWVGWQFYSGLKLLFKYRTADMNTLVSI